MQSCTAATACLRQIQFVVRMIKDRTLLPPRAFQNENRCAQKKKFAGRSPLNVCEHACATKCNIICRLKLDGQYNFNCSNYEEKKSPAAVAVIQQISEIRCSLRQKDCLLLEEITAATMNVTHREWHRSQKGILEVSECAHFLIPMANGPILKIRSEMEKDRHRPIINEGQETFQNASDTRREGEAMIQIKETFLWSHFCGSWVQLFCSKEAQNLHSPRLLIYLHSLVVFGWIRPLPPWDTYLSFPPLRLGILGSRAAL